MITRIEVRPEELEVLGGRTVSAAYYPAGGAPLPAGFVLAHGAGAGHSSPFIRDFASALAQRGINVLTFNFPYMEARRRIPDRAEVLEACFETAVGRLRELRSPEDRVFIGGKSMGGRIASQLAARQDSPPAAGLILLGYPLHPPGRSEQLRTAHLDRLALPVLIVQGTRDSFGTPDELKPWFSRPNMTIYPVKGGDHSFKIRTGPSAPTQEEVYRDIQDAIRSWVERVAG
ncbi:MAG: alpha/beta fold hydrolase [Acidobacteriota bacterium]